MGRKKAMVSMYGIGVRNIQFAEKANMIRNVGSALATN